MISDEEVKHGFAQLEESAAGEIAFEKFRAWIARRQVERLIREEEDAEEEEVLIQMQEEEEERLAAAEAAEEERQLQQARAEEEAIKATIRRGKKASGHPRSTARTGRRRSPGRTQQEELPKLEPVQPRPDCSATPMLRVTFSGSLNALDIAQKKVRVCRADRSVLILNKNSFGSFPMHTMTYNRCVHAQDLMDTVAKTSAEKLGISVSACSGLCLVISHLCACVCVCEKL